MLSYTNPSSMAALFVMLGGAWAMQLGDGGNSTPVQLMNLDNKAAESKKAEEAWKVAEAKKAEDARNAEEAKKAEEANKTEAAGWPTPHPTFPAMRGAAAGGAAATGDPHLQNVNGERFDLMQPGKHVLISIPRGERAEKAMLRVEAEARRLGGHCADMYFQELNITGAWVEAKQAGGLSLVEAKQTGGLFFHAQSARDEHPDWMKIGKVDLKVVHGRTQQGLEYLNFYVKHLGRSGYVVGGLLGEDDHTEAETPSEGCVERVSLSQGVIGNAQRASVSVAEASFD